MPKICSVDGCGREVEAKGLCSRHYYRQKRGGDITTKSLKEKTLEERFWEKVDKKDDAECWLWTGTKDQKGYGMFKVSNEVVSRHHRAHRVAYELVKGPIPKGLYACHKCDIPSCVNPNHLFLGTNDDNMKDMVAKGRSSKERSYHILTLDQAREIYRSKGKELARVLAERFQVAMPTIYAIWSQRNWKELSKEGTTTP